MKILRYVPLASRVLAVAVLGERNDWSVYIDAVPGINHNKEQIVVAQHGDKISLELASIIFPEYAEKYEWRN